MASYEGVAEEESIAEAEEKPDTQNPKTLTHKGSSSIQKSMCKLVHTLTHMKQKSKEVKNEYRLIAEQDVLVTLRPQVWCLCRCCTCDSEDPFLSYFFSSHRLLCLDWKLGTTVLNPNYPFMVTPGNHKDSFPDTEPVGFSAATYCVPLSGLLGVAIVSAFIGSLSDKWGRRPLLLICVGGSVVATIGKYIARQTFWGFCAGNFENGL